MIKKRSVVIIDGSNLYFKLKSLGLKKGFKFNYKAWIKKLTQGTTLISAYYCVGKIRAKQKDIKARQMMSSQQSFVTQLTKSGFIIQYGYLLKSDRKFNEKGVDVQMAVDILRGAYKDEYDQVFLISSDSDLIPAIEEAQISGKEVVYVGFKHQPSYALLKTCKRSILLDKSDIKEF